MLEVRPLNAGSGLETRGLHSLQADGSMNVGFYDEWSVPPAEGVSDALRLWLGGSGKFSAVIGQDSGVQPDLVLTGTLTALWTIAARQIARAAIVMTLIDQRPLKPKVMLQRNFAAETPVGSDTSAAAAAAQIAALAEVFRQIDAALP